MARDTLDQAQHRLDAGDGLARRHRRPHLAGPRQRQGLLGFGQFAFQPAALVGQRARRGPADRRIGVLMRGGGFARDFGLAGQIAARMFGGQRLDAAHARRHRAFRQDGEKPDIAQAVDMGAAAQFDRIGLFGFVEIVAHGQHAHFVAIFFAEQGFGARGDGLIGGHQAGGGVGILPDHFIDLGFDRVPVRPASPAWDGRSRSAAVRPSTSEPFWLTWLPSTRLSAACSRWVAE